MNRAKLAMLVSQGGPDYMGNVPYTLLWTNGPSSIDDTQASTRLPSLHSSLLLCLELLPIPFTFIIWRQSTQYPLKALPCLDHN